MIDNEDRVTEYAKEIVSNMKDPYEMPAFWIFNEQALESCLTKWKTYNPKVKLHYAVKCNPSPLLIKPLVEAGYSFDCATINEILEVMNFGCTPERIVFSQSFKPIPHLVKAYELGLRLTIVDSYEEIKKIAKYAPEMKVLLRLNHSDASALYKLGGRFGIDDDDVEPMIQAIKEAGLTMVGTHFHVGSQALSIEAFQKGIEFAKSVFDVAQKYGFKPNIVDLGGGFSHFVDISKFGPAIEKAFDDNNFPEGTQMMAEPGLYVAATPFGIGLQIHGKKNRKYPDGKNGYDYTVADGLHGCFAYTIFYKKELPGEILHVSHPLKEEKIPSVFFGPTCDSQDLILTTELPELEIGDWIFFHRCGAYTMSLATNFNGFESLNIKIFELSKRTSNSNK